MIECGMGDGYFEVEDERDNNFDPPIDFVGGTRNYPRIRHSHLSVRVDMQVDHTLEEFRERYTVLGGSNPQPVTMTAPPPPPDNRAAKRMRAEEAERAFLAFAAPKSPAQISEYVGGPTTVRPVREPPHESWCNSLYPDMMEAPCDCRGPKPEEYGPIKPKCKCPYGNREHMPPNPACEIYSHTVPKPDYKGAVEKLIAVIRVCILAWAHDDNKIRFGLLELD